MPAARLEGPYLTAGDSVHSAAFGAGATGTWVGLGLPESGALKEGLPAGSVYLLEIPRGDGEVTSGATAWLSGDEDRQGTGHDTRSPGDVDGDGLDDLLVMSWVNYEWRGSITEGTVSLILGPLSGSLHPQWTLDAEASCQDMDAGLDVTGDALPDIVIGGGLVYWGYYPSGVAILDASQNGGFSPWDAPTLLEVDAPGVALHPDMDGDGLADLILGTDDGTVAVQGPIEPGSIWSELTPLTLDPDYTRDLVLLPDLDGDGVADVAAYVAEGTAGIAVISGRGGRRTTFALGSSSALPIDDLDGDGLRELAIGADWSDITDEQAGAVWIFSGAATGTLTEDDALTVLLGTSEDQVLGSALAWTPGTLLIGDATGAWFVDTSTILVP